MLLNNNKYVYELFESVWESIVLKKKSLYEPVELFTPFYLEVLVLRYFNRLTIYENDKKK